MKGYLKTAILIAVAGTLASCGGGTSGNGASTSGMLNLSITDAPVDGASAVNVTIDSISIKRTNGSEQTVKMNGSDTTDNKITVNLMDLQGKSAALFANNVTSGDYQWVRFHLTGANICFPDKTPSCYDLNTPTPDELKTSGSFNVPGNGVANITVDWDLRKSIVQNGTNGTYKLKPVLHLRDNSEVGSITGNVTTTCAADQTRAVYVYSGSITTPGDIGGNGTQPLATVLVQIDNGYSISALAPGTYTLAATCDAKLDLLDSDESDTMTFTSPLQATVTAGEVTANVFIPGP